MDPMDNNCTGMNPLVHSASTLPLVRGTNQRQRQKRWHRDTKSQMQSNIDSLDTQDSNATLEKFRSVDTHLEPATTLDSMDTAQAESPLPPPPPPISKSPVSSGSRTPIIGGIDGQVMSGSPATSSRGPGYPFTFDAVDSGSRSLPVSGTPHGDMQLIDLGPESVPAERTPTPASLTLIPDFLTGSTASIPQATSESRRHSPHDLGARSPSIGLLPGETSDSFASLGRPPGGNSSKSTSGSLSRTSSRRTIPAATSRPLLETDIDELLPRFADMGTQVGSPRLATQQSSSRSASETPTSRGSSSARDQHRQEEIDPQPPVFGSSTDLRTTRV